ncbi:MAG: ATP-binding protein [Candidatus Diapherotrites archaeon]|nr:ATP-binding protein [Candidatus Diapherotrites archaeon]
MVLEKLKDWNPWWAEGEVPEKLHGKPRRITGELFNLAKARDLSKVIIGPRRSGKTTVMYQIIQKLINSGVNPNHILYVNLEDPALSDAEFDEIYSDFVQFSKSKENYLFFDEIQVKKDWDKWIRAHLEKRQNDSIYVSGSTMSLMKHEAGRRLAGRVLMKTIYPLSFNELLSLNNITFRNSQEKDIALGLLKECLLLGCYPRVVFEQDVNLKREILVSYFDTIVARDVAASHKLDFKKAQDIFSYILRNTSSLFSVNKIKNMFHLSYETAERYVDAMKDSMVLIESRRYSFSLREQMAFPRKFYTIDLGLRWVSSRGPTEDMGKLLESFIAEELVKHGYEFYYWSDERQCDFVIVGDGKPKFALQVSYELTKENKKREHEGLNEAMDEFGIPGRVLTFEDAPEFVYLLGNEENPFK